MASNFKAPRGTFDILPDNGEARAWVEGAAKRILGRAGFEPIATPVFEDTALFIRGVGKSTDIVQKEMFTFEDKGERSLTLRPEGTAPICRAYLEHGMQKWAPPVKLSYVGPFFRHERPQAGRFRQFHQIGVETIGTDSPLADAEAITVLSELLDELGVPGVELRIGSLGSVQPRARYLEHLTAFLEQHEQALSEDVRARFRLNPLRAFDSKEEATRKVMSEAPTLVESLSGEDAEHFEEVQRLLKAAGIEYAIDPTLVRGLDYYSRTIFSFVCPSLGAQSEVGGGGRYDGLIEQLGGPPTPAIGWAVGIERILLALGEGAGPESAEPRVFVVHGGGAVGSYVMTLLGRLRQAGFYAQADLAGRGVKGQLKHANRLKAGVVVIVRGSEAVELRDMESGRQWEADVDNLLEEVSEVVS
jgi:histidyl-tRNA synthetase